MAGKTYVVMKDDNEIETLKTFTAAKKLAESEKAEVYCNGELLYNAEGEADDSDLNIGTDPGEVQQDELISNLHDSFEDKADLVPTAETDSTARKYKLLNLMNVRKEPSMLADVIGTLPSGTVVEVSELKDDWLYLTDGSYILYCSGKFAEQV